MGHIQRIPIQDMPLSQNLYFCLLSHHLYLDMAKYVRIFWPDPKNSRPEPDIFDPKQKGVDQLLDLFCWPTRPEPFLIFNFLAKKKDNICLIVCSEI